MITMAILVYFTYRYLRNLHSCHIRQNLHLHHHLHVLKILNLYCDTQMRCMMMILIMAVMSVKIVSALLLKDS